MSKIEMYRAQLTELDDWDSFLLQESNLPGPRANLELAFAVASEGADPLFLRYAALDPENAPANSPREFLTFCGVLGLGYNLTPAKTEHWSILRSSASDPRWRTREAVALGLQHYGKEHMENLVITMQSWLAGNLLERRAVVAALCHPDLLRDPHWTAKVFDILDKITASIMEEANRRSDSFRALRKTLGYVWSVAVAAQPDLGKACMENWIGVEDKDIRWIMKQNLMKKRLARLDAAWVNVQLECLA